MLFYYLNLPPQGQLTLKPDIIKMGCIFPLTELYIIHYVYIHTCIYIYIFFTFESTGVAQKVS